MELLTRYEQLYTAVVADVLDALGHRRQTLAPGITALDAGGPLAGYAATLRVEAVDEVPETPYVVQFRAVDELRDGDVMVVEAPPSVASAFWGELISTRAEAAGCRGAIVDGYTRDSAAIRRRGFRVWARGTHPADSAGRLDAVEAGGRIRCGGVTVEPGDVILADADGIVVTPRTLAERVATLAEEKAATETAVRQELRAGRTVSDTYDEYGVM
jgi:4-hydroxy-4-methyl-2-oxoglutarate aldolase